MPFYPSIPAGDGTSLTAPANALFEVYELTDTAFTTPLPLTTSSGLNAAPLMTTAQGVCPPVNVTSPNLSHIFKSGTWEWRRDSFDGAAAAVEDARAAAVQVQQRIESGELKGGQGEPGPRGLPGVNATPAAEAVAEYAKTPGNPLNEALGLLGGYANVQNFGAQGDGVADDTSAVQKAIDSLKDGGVLWFPHGTYRTTKTLTVNVNGVTLSGPNGTVIKPTLPSLGVGLKAAGSRQSKVTTVTAPAIKGQLTITTASPLTAGAIIVIRSEVESFNDDRAAYTKGEIAIVQSVSGLTATLQTALRDSYTPAKGTVSIDVLRMIKDFSIKDLTVEMGGTGLAQTGVSAQYVRGLRYEGLRVFNSARQGITADVCLDVAVSGTHTEGADEPGMAYGVLLGGCQNITINGNTGRRNRHSIEVSSNAPQPMSRDITITGNAVSNDLSAGISTHGGTENVTVTGNTVAMCGGGIVTRGAHTTVSDNTIITAPSNSPESYKSPLFFGDDGTDPRLGYGRAGDHLIVSNNRVVYLPGAVMDAVPAVKITAPLINAVFEGNVFSGFTAHGIFAQGNYNDGVQVAGNIFDGKGAPQGEAGRCGILISPREVSGTSWTRNLTVQGNQFLNMRYAPLLVTGPSSAATPAENIHLIDNYVDSAVLGFIFASGGHFNNVVAAGNIFTGALPLEDRLAQRGTFRKPLVEINTIFNGAPLPATPTTWNLRQTFAASPALATGIPLLALDTSGATVDIAQVTSSGILYYGPGGTTPRTVVVRTGPSGQMRLRVGASDPIVLGDGGVGFYGTNPVPKASGVAKTPEALHKVLSDLGLISG